MRFSELNLDMSLIIQITPESSLKYREMFNFRLKLNSYVVLYYTNKHNASLN